MNNFIIQYPYSYFRNLPGVGKNLQDHIMVGLASECSLPITMDQSVVEVSKYDTFILFSNILNQCIFRHLVILQNIFYLKKDHLQVKDLKVMHLLIQNQKIQQDLIFNFILHVEELIMIISYQIWDLIQLIY